MKRLLLLIAALVVIAVSTEGKPKPRLVWNIGLDYVFDNREFAAGHDSYTRSMTIHAVNLQPSIGVSLKQGRYRHSIHFGMDLQRDMGSRSKALDPCLFWYDFTNSGRKGSFDATFGVYSRHKLEGEYGRAFISDSVRVYDRTLEGALLKWKYGRFMAELGCDWRGRQEPGVRERFEVFTYGQWRPADRLRLGWTANVDHFANPAGVVLGVCDDILVEPFAAYDFTPRRTKWDKIELRLSWLQSLQRDRKAGTGFMAGGGGDARLTAVFRGFGLESDNYAGTDLMPLYQMRDPSGLKYGDIMCHGDPFYRASCQQGAIGIYSRNEFFWHKSFSKNASMRLSWIFHFTDCGYQGSQQMFTAVLLL